MNNDRIERLKATAKMLTESIQVGDGIYSQRPPDEVALGEFVLDLLAKTPLQLAAKAIDENIGRVTFASAYAMFEIKRIIYCVQDDGLFMQGEMVNFQRAKPDGHEG